jgi:hypothetical protein
MEEKTNQLALAESYSAQRAGKNKGQTLDQTFIVFLISDSEVQQ